MAVELGENANTLSQNLVPQSQQIDAQLAVLGPAPEAREWGKRDL